MIKSMIINNFGNIENEQIDFKKFNIFQGASLQGKSTFLQAIKWCIIGGNDDHLIRHGASTCEVILLSDNGNRMERRLTRGGTSKFFLYQNERPIEKPQEIINKLFNPFLFGPTDLILMKPKDLNETITTAISKRLKLTPEQIKFYKLESLDLSEDPVNAIQKYYDQLYAERTEVNRTVKNLENKTAGAVMAVPSTIELNNLEIEIKDLDKKINDAKEFNIRLEISKKNIDIKTKTETNINILEKEIQDGSTILNQITEFTNLLLEQEKEIDTLQKSVDQDRHECNTIKATLDKLDSGEIKCPIHALIKCTTDMGSYKTELSNTFEKSKKNGKENFEKVNKLQASINKLKLDIENGKNLKQKQVELDRAKSILNELEILSGEIVNLEELEKSLKEKNDLLSRGKLAIELSKISGLAEGKKRQLELEEIMSSLNTLIKQVIPSLLTLNVKNVTLSKEGLFFQGLPFYRLGDSYKLRLCTAILKDLYPKANIFTLDRMECIDQEQLVKYVDFYAKEKNQLQYFGSYVGMLNKSFDPNVKIFTVENFKVKNNVRENS